MIEQENELKSLLTEQPFEGIENTDLLLAQTRARAKGFALATEGIAVVSDFKKQRMPHLRWQIRTNYNESPSIYD